MTPTSRIGILLVLTFFSSAAVVWADRGGDELAARIDAFQEHFDEANRLSGVLLIAKGDEVVFHRAYGMAHIGLAVPNSLDSRIGIASINKIMTSVVLARLVAEGTVALGDPIARFLPSFPRADEITIEQLARHRAGIPHRVTSRCEESLPNTAQDIVDRASEVPLLFEPGTASSYSSAGYTVLARCLEIAAGVSFGDLLRKYVFDPAEMSATVDLLPGREPPGLSNAYVPARGELWPAPRRDMAFLVGAGSVVSTAEDLWRFVRAFRDGRLGVPFEAFAPQGVVSWTGASNGIHSFIDVHPEDRLTCIFVGNSWGGCTGALRSALPALCRGESPTPPTRPPLTSPSSTDLADYVGRYAIRLGASYEVRVLAGELWMEDSMLLAIGLDRFWHQPWHCEVAFLRDPSGHVTSLERRGTPASPPWPRAD